MKQIAKNIKFVGAEDENIDLFEAQYPVINGISYNSYLIEDENIAVVDAVDVRRTADWLEALESALEGRLPRYLIVQHMEPDHSGSIRDFVNRYPEAVIVCSQKAAAMLANFFEDVDFSSRVKTVADGEELSLGRVTLRFIAAPMVHWPEVMLTLDVTDGVLFSADAFGSFAMSTADVDSAWDDEARRYYTNIVGRFGQSVQALMKKLTGQKFSVIAPLHGPALTGNLARYWKLYDKWSRYEAERNGVFVAYASIYGGTAEVARRIAARLRADARSGEVVVMDLCRTDVSYAVAEAFRLNRMVLCSVTYDGTLFPAMHNLLHHIEAKRLNGRTVALVENGTWAPVAGRHMAEVLSAMKDMRVVAPVLTIRSRFKEADSQTADAMIQDLLG